MADTITGTLEKCMISKKGTGYNLKADWDDDKEWQWVPLDTLDPLLEAQVVFEDGEYDDGNTRYGVRPIRISLKTTWKGKQATKTISIAKTEVPPDNEPTEMERPDSAPAASRSSKPAKPQASQTEKERFVDAVEQSVCKVVIAISAAMTATQGHDMVSDTEIGLYARQMIIDWGHARIRIPDYRIAKSLRKALLKVVMAEHREGLQDKGPPAKSYEQRPDGIDDEPLWDEGRGGKSDV